MAAKVRGDVMNVQVEEYICEYLDTIENAKNQQFALVGIKFWKDEYEQEGETLPKFLRYFVRGSWMYTSLAN